jgi:hypothetical protein
MGRTYFFLVHRARAIPIFDTPSGATRDRDYEATAPSGLVPIQDCPDGYPPFDIGVVFDDLRLSLAPRLEDKCVLFAHRLSSRIPPDGIFHSESRVRGNPFPFRQSVDLQTNLFETCTDSIACTQHGGELIDAPHPCFPRRL